MQTRTSLQLTVLNGADAIQGQVNLTETTAGVNFLGTSQSITTVAWTAIGKGNCANLDLVFIKNMDAANYVQLATANDGSHIFSRLKAGRGAAFPVESAVTIYSKATGGICVVEVIGAEP